MRFKLPPLPYNVDSLAPAISSQTLATHHGKHHLGYIDRLNELLPESDYRDASLEEIIKNAPPGALFNQAAQAWNHEFYWLGLAPAEDCHPIDQWPELKSALETNFGSVPNFISEFKEAAEQAFGSGWVWLVENPQIQTLSIVTTHDAENPLRSGLNPLWACDVWEHAYYLDYRNERKRYLENIWSIANWKSVQARLGASRSPEMTGLLRADRSTDPSRFTGTE